MTRLYVAARTHTGRVREENQDCVLVDAWVSARDAMLARSVELRPGQTPYVVAVCDGLGGHAGGAVASRLAAATLGATDWPGIDEKVVTERVVEAARAIQQVSDDVHGLRGLGSTVAGIALTATQLSVFNVGDSSVFRVMDGSLGELTRPDRRPDPHRAGATVLTQSLSVFTAVPDPSVATLAIARPMRLVACSDGLTDVVGTDDLRSLLAGEVGAPDGAREAVQRLIERALRQGAPDNVSVIVIDLVPDEARVPE
ncbi:serine/threonine-protein phosphatase [Kribbella sp. NBC_00482]|uniref:PP2C family protein-serine/threonine phosphatase n=1 Tax=Kribbella sp. NBC_00482 TaxID=2975968 RepID=UPI002E1748AE